MVWLLLKLYQIPIMNRWLLLLLPAMADPLQRLPLELEAHLPQQEAPLHPQLWATTGTVDHPAPGEKLDHLLLPLAAGILAVWPLVHGPAHPMAPHHPMGLQLLNLRDPQMVHRLPHLLDPPMVHQPLILLDPHMGPQQPHLWDPPMEHQLRIPLVWPRRIKMITRTSRCPPTTEVPLPPPQDPATWRLEPRGDEILPHLHPSLSLAAKASLLLLLLLLQLEHPILLHLLPPLLRRMHQAILTVLLLLLPAPPMAPQRLLPAIAMVLQLLPPAPPMAPQQPLPATPMAPQQTLPAIPMDLLQRLLPLTAMALLGPPATQIMTMKRSRSPLTIVLAAAPPAEQVPEAGETELLP